MSTKLERILYIVSDINRGTYPSAQDLCSKYEIAIRTFYADIELIRDRLRIEIVHDAARGGYYNSTPDVKLPEFDLFEDEIQALLLSKEMMLGYSGPTYRIELEQALRKITSRLANKESIPIEEIHSLVRVIPTGVAPTASKELSDLREAADKKKTVEIDYYATSTGEQSTRKIDPYKIIQHDGTWYVAGWCHQRKDMRKFAIHRIKGHRILKENFQIQEGFDIEKWLDSAFIIEHRDGEQLVRIRFSPVGARYALDKEWRPNQKVQKHPDGSCTLEFTTQSLDEVKRWVLPFGSGAEVIDPPELRRRVMEELQLTLRNYKDS
jgi:predicted DNA-binding transcriptional regulator YafY